MKLFTLIYGVLFSLFLSVSAHAALPAGLETALTALQADAVLVAGAFTPIIIAVLALFVVIKLMKRFGNRI